MTRFFLCLFAVLGIACIAGAQPPVVVARQRAVLRTTTAIQTPAPVVSTVMEARTVTESKTVMIPTTVTKVVNVPTVVTSTRTVQVPVTTVSAAGPPVVTTRTTVRGGWNFPVAKSLTWGFWR